MIIVNYLPNLLHSPLIHSSFFLLLFQQKSENWKKKYKNFKNLNEIKNKVKINNKEKEKVNEQLKRLKKNVKNFILKIREENSFLLIKYIL